MLNASEGVGGEITGNKGVTEAVGLEKEIIGITFNKRNTRGRLCV